MSKIRSSNSHVTFFITQLCCHSELIIYAVSHLGHGLPGEKSKRKGTNSRTSRARIDIQGRMRQHAS